MKLLLFFIALVPFFCFSKVKVGIIDTGVSIHDDIKPYLKKGISFVDGNTNDDHEHGTYMAGTIVRDSAVKNVEIYPIKNMKWDQKTEQFSKYDTLFLSQAIEFAIKNNIKILNISEESPIFSVEDFLALKKAQKHNIILVAAAGNSIKELTINDKLPVYPCQYGLDNVVCVGAYELKGEKLKVTSNYGKEVVDCVAPAQDILGINNRNTYSIMSGSSVATAQVSALVVNVMSKNPSLNYKEVLNKVFESMSLSNDLKEFTKKGRFIKY